MTARRTDPRPPEAWWSEEDHEWVLGDKDEHGRLTGLIRHWDAAGRFVCESEQVAGRPHVERLDLKLVVPDALDEAG